MTRRLLFLFSDTGGGHRSAAEAVQEALQAAAGRFEIEMVDFFKAYSPPPFNRLPELYPAMVRRPGGWAAGYRVTNGPRRVRSIGRLTWPYVRRAARRIVREHPANLIVSFHPLANDAVVRALSGLPPAARPPFAVIVTDLVSTHAFWYHRGADLTVVPTEPAYRHAVECGLKPERLRLVGLPVATRFRVPAGEPEQLRADLGWEAGRKTVLIVGGGDGMGPIERTAMSVAESGLPVSLAVVCGRNTALKARLERREWPVPVHVYGFVDRMPDLMRAADVLVTKAGPGTISEALNAGLPSIIYSYLPGQEAGNVPYLTEHGAGLWAPSPEEVVAGLRSWIEDPEGYARAVRAANALARPGAAEEIAALLVGLAGTGGDS